MATVWPVSTDSLTAKATARARAPSAPSTMGLAPPAVAAAKASSVTSYKSRRSEAARLARPGRSAITNTYAPRRTRLSAAAAAIPLAPVTTALTPVVVGATRL
jgi:hypothetical protein